VTSFLALVLSAASSPLVPCDLRCEYLQNPMGIDEAQPRLSWIDTSSRRGAKQAAYRIAVTTRGSGKKTVLWDSGKVNSDESSQIEYAGPALDVSTEAEWRVTVWDDSGKMSTSRESAYWEKGLANASDWHAKWISLTQPAKDPVQIPSPYMRKEFTTRRSIVSAVAYVSAKGLYRFYVDGHRIGKAQIAPDWTDYHKRIQYQTYDVKEALSGTHHAAGIVLGNGWYCGHVGLTGGDNYGTNPEGIVQIEVKYGDGSVEEIVSDETWTGRTGPILSNDLLMGETEDARLAMPGWSVAGRAGTGWGAVVTQPLGDVPLVSQQNPPVEVLEELKPKAMLPTKTPDTYLFDLGQNMVGWARLKVRGQAGETVQLRFAEILNPDGTIYTTNLRGAKATDLFTLSGHGTETFEPSFTTHGFRYVEVTGSKQPLGLNSLTGIVVGSGNPQTGEFACSNPLVNQLFHNIYWGERGNYLAIPTDCPQRDERLGWMGDAQIFARTATCNNDVAAFLTKWTQDVVDAQSAEGGFSDVSPRMGDPSDGAPAWGDAGVIVPYTVYLAYGDKRLLQRRYPAMKAWVNYIDSVNPDHIWIQRSNNNFGDWLNVNDDTPRPVIATAYFAYSTDLLAKTARILGYTDDAEKFEALRTAIGDAFNSHFVGSDGKIQGDTQTSYVLALRFDLLPEAIREQAAKRLTDHILIDRKGHLSTGFVGVGYLNPTLTRYGRSDVAYQLLTTDTYPSWGYSIRQGATTIWERWDGYTKEKGFQDPGMNSFNHYSLGSVGEWMYRTVAGIDLDPAAPGFKKIVIHPIPGGGITWAHAKFQSIHGLIATSWKDVGITFTLDATVPANTTATILVPIAFPGARVTESGLPAESHLVSAASKVPGFASYEVGGGKYHFEVTNFVR
jgi:alpha-L-rhamnosidase